ncbi:ABC transporter substrate-binding protein [Kineococcus sp. G2]|uniref:ABC transporter substrate-binding protein n=1 Tax=Kineococcus sp. G2 TaxID=3127484 RepID=UPI00301D7F8C
MLLSTPRRSLLGAAGTFALGALALAGCGSDSLSGAEPSSPASTSAAAVEVTADPALTAMLPQSVQDSGVLRVGTNAEYAPNEFLRDGEVVGMDIDLMDAVAAKLGVEAEYQNAGFDTLITGVQGNRYDAAISSFTVNPERLQQVNMVQYFNAGTQWAVREGNPDGIDPQNPCGATVAVQNGTVQADVDLPARQQECADAGQPAIDVVPFDSQQDATAALVQGRVQAVLADSPVVGYAVQQSEGIELVGDVYDAAPYGVVVPKEQTQTAEAISQALRALAEEGAYDAAIEAWGAQEGAVDEFPVNPAQ